MKKQDANQSIIDNFLVQDQATQAVPPPSPDENVTTFLDDQGTPQPASTLDKAAASGNKAAQKIEDAKTREAEARARLAEARADQAERQPEQVATVVQPPDTVTQLAQDAGRVSSQLTDWIASLPTPGGIMALVFALLFFVWVIVPVNGNGDTRLFLFWKVLTGQTQIDPNLATAGQGSIAAPFVGTTFTTPAPLQGIAAPTPGPTSPVMNPLTATGGGYIREVQLAEDWFGKLN